MRDFSITPILIGMILGSCGPRSDNHLQYLSLTGQDQLNYVRNLPLQDRVDLYSEIYDSSSHPRDSSLSIVFRGDGYSVANYVLSRISDQRDFIKYIWIIKSMDQSGSINACHGPVSLHIGEMARSVLSKSNASMYISFRDCTVADLM